MAVRALTTDINENRKIFLFHSPLREGKKMNVPFLNLSLQYKSIKNEISDALKEIIDTNAFAGGPAVERFEKSFSDYCQCEFAVGCGSGTDALWIALHSLGIGPRDAVITVPNTFIATAEAISLCGATPVFVDCDEYGGMDPKKLKELLDVIASSEGNFKPNTLKQYDIISDRRKIKDWRLEIGGRGLKHAESQTSSEIKLQQIRAILPVHLYGQPANMEEIMAVAKEYGLLVVEDACQAHGATYKGRRVGSIGNAGCFSFYPGKNLGAYGEAGAVVTNDAALAERMGIFRDHGQVQKYFHSMVGWNARMDGFQGAVLSVKIKHIEAWTKKRQQNAALYTELLSDIEGIETPKELEGVESVYHLYVIKTDDRDGMQQYLKKKGIDTGLHYPIPLHLQDAYLNLGYKEGDFPVAETAAKRILSLPMFPELSEVQIQYVCEKIKTFMFQHGDTESTVK